MKAREFLERIKKLNRLVTQSNELGRLQGLGKRDADHYRAIAAERDGQYNEILDMLTGVGEHAKRRLQAEQDAQRFEQAVGFDANLYANGNGSYGAIAAFHDLASVWQSQVELGEAPIDIMTEDIGECIVVLTQMLEDTRKRLKAQERG